MSTCKLMQSFQLRFEFRRIDTKNKRKWNKIFVARRWYKIKWHYYLISFDAMQCFARTNAVLTHSVIHFPMCNRDSVQRSLLRFFFSLSCFKNWFTEIDKNECTSSCFKWFTSKGEKVDLLFLGNWIKWIKIHDFLTTSYRYRAQCLFTDLSFLK